MTSQQTMTKPQMIAKFFINDLKGIMKKKGFKTDKGFLFAMYYLHDMNNLTYMLDMYYDNYIDRQTLKLWVMDSLDKLNEIKDFMLYVNQKVTVNENNSIH